MQRVIAIVGPTAVGKTEIALRLAERLGGEIINMDSIQIYQRLDIGSAKPSPEEIARVPHHCLDFVDPSLDFTVAEYKKHAEDAIDDITHRGKLPILAGGTGLYLHALMYDMDFNDAAQDDTFRKEMEALALREGPQALHDSLAAIDPDSAVQIHPNNVRRVIRALEINKHTGSNKKSVQTHLELNKNYDIILIGLNMNRHRLYARINLRVEQMLANGLMDEVGALRDSGLNETMNAMKGIGYKEVLAHLDGKWDHETMVRMIKQNSRHYAKRQLTWFKRYPDITWFDVDAYSAVEKLVGEIEEIIAGRDCV